MDQPSAGLAIQGLLSHILVEDYSDIQKKLADINSTNTNTNKDAENLEEKLADTSKAGDEESDIDSSQGEKERTVVAFYKLEMIRIQLITAQGDQVCNYPFQLLYVNLFMFLQNISLSYLIIVAYLEICVRLVLVLFQNCQIAWFSFSSFTSYLDSSFCCNLMLTSIFLTFGIRLKLRWKMSEKHNLMLLLMHQLKS